MDSMREATNRIPAAAQLRGSPLPFPGSAIVGGEEAPVKTSLRRAKSGRGLDRGLLPAKTQIFLGRGNGSLVMGGWYNADPDQAKGNETYGFFPL